jgi:hypothetical protein
LLSIYLVRYYPVIEQDASTLDVDHGLHMALVIAESAQQARDTVAFSGDRFVAQIADEDGVGRLGKYEPGMEGHRMVASRPAIVLLQRV